MNSDRIKEIQMTTAYPESVSVQQALLQVWNECEQEKVKNCSIPVVKASLPDKDNYDYLRGFLDGYGGSEPHECFPEGFKDINEVMDRMWELGEQRQ